MQIVFSLFPVPPLEPVNWGWSPLCSLENHVIPSPPPPPNPPLRRKYDDGKIWEEVIFDGIKQTS